MPDSTVPNHGKQEVQEKSEAAGEGEGGGRGSSSQSNESTNERAQQGKGKDTESATGKGAVWRNNWPAITTPINILFPPRPPPSTLPLIAASSNRAAWRARKLLFRAMLVTLACLVLLLEPTSLKALGNAAFFGCIVSIMIPPTFPAMVFVLVATMLVLGMALGWAWSCAAMAAALFARDQVFLASQLQIAQQSAATAVNPSVAFQVSIFRGDFLDWRSTLVFGCFFAVGTFAMGLLRANNAKLTLVAIFGSIVMDVMFSYGSLFPFARYTLATSFLIPTACFVAIGMIANFTIFPETLNSSYTTDLVDKFLIPVLQRSHLHSNLLATSPPTKEGGSVEWEALGTQFDETQRAISAGLEGLLGSTAMLELEVSYGRLGAKDLKEMGGRLREVLARSMGLGVLLRTVQRQHRRRFGTEAPASATTLPIPTTSTRGPMTSTPRLTARMARLRTKVDAAELAYNHSLAALLPLFSSSSAPLRTATDDALLGAMEWLTTTSSSRWGRQLSEEVVEVRYRAQRGKVEALALQIAEWKTQGRLAVTAPFASFFHPTTGALLLQTPKRHFSPASLFVVLSASDNLLVYSQAVYELTKQLSELEDKRRRNKLWWPTGLRKIGNLVKGGKGVGEMGDGENPEEVTLVGDGEESEEGGEGESEGEKCKGKGKGKGKKGTEEDEPDFFAKKKWESHDPDAKPPKNARQRFALKLYYISKWAHNAETIFAFKYMIGSILLWLPQVFPSSAYFVYTEKGLWSLIMLQTGLAVYAGDQILQTVQKLTGTALGLVYGMLIWYIGSGTGTGSRPGLGAAFYILMLPAMAIRLYAPPAMMQLTMMMAVTTVLVVGYSWSNAHLPTLGNPGIGYHLAWKRALLVIIGTAAATILMMFPSPQSTRLLVRRTHATCIDQIGRLYAATLSAWLSEERRSSAQENGATVENLDDHLPSAFTQSVQKTARARMLAIWTKLNGTKASILQSSYELSLRGDWPKKEYLHLLETQLSLVQALAQLGQALTRLDPHWRRTLVKQTAFLNPNLISDVSSTFTLLSLALRQGSPLPEATPGPLLDRLLYHDARLRNLTEREDEEHPHSQVEGASVGDFELTLGVLQDEQFATHASAILALANILSALDELEETTKELVGEVSMPGYHDLLARRAEV